MFVHSINKFVVSTLISVSLFRICSSATENTPCAPRLYDKAQSIVCVCNETYCDNFNFDWSKQGSIVQIQSSLAGKRFQLSVPKEEADISRSVSSNTSKRYLNQAKEIQADLNNQLQKIVGFGGAATDAFLINLNKLSESTANLLVNSYFADSGLEYSLCRVPIAGCDFSDRTYSYDDCDEQDLTLKNWALAKEDTLYRIPFIKKVNALSKSYGRELRWFASPWSPPLWMKSNHQVSRGQLIDDDKIYSAYANYLVKFFDVYKQNGISFWGATVQNEPFAKNDFNSLDFSVSEQIRFIGKFYGPALAAAGYNKTNFKLMVGDDSLGASHVDLRVQDLLKSSEVQKYVSSIAYHWYGTTNLNRPRINTMYEKTKDKIEFMLMTEACSGAVAGSIDKGVKLGSWQRAEDYATDIIEDLRRYTSGWVDWNMALDLKGSPNWAKNYVDAPVIVNETSNEFLKQPMFYVLGHFSKFFKSDDVIIASELIGDDQLLTVAAYRRTQNAIVINVLNKRNENVESFLKLKKTSGEIVQYRVSLDSKSINTFIVKLT